jgi:hypothetical protein
VRRAINRLNIGVCRWTNTAHMVLAKTTIEGSKKLVSALKEITTNEQGNEDKETHLAGRTTLYKFGV